MEECDDPQYKEPAGDDDSSDDEDREDMPVDSQQNTFVKQSKSRTFLKPYQVLIVWLSEFDNALLPSSAACQYPAHQQSSKIIKNRLRTSLADKSLSSLLVLSSKKTCFDR